MAIKTEELEIPPPSGSIPSRRSLAPNRSTLSGRPARPTRSQGNAAWIFGTGLVLFFGFVAYHPPIIGQSIQYATFTLLAAFLAGFFGFFITGTVVTETKWEMTPKLTIDTRATGGFAFALIAIGIFFYFSPYRTPEEAAAKLSQALNNLPTAPASTSPGPQGASGSQTGLNSQSAPQPAPEVKLTPEIQAQAAELAKASPKFSSLSALAKSDKVPLKTFQEARKIVQKESSPAAQHQ